MSKAQTGKRRRARGGFTLAETLLTVLILALVSGSLAGGVSFAVRQYNDSMRLSEAKTLCSTLTSVIQSKLANASVVKKVEPESGSDPVYQFGEDEDPTKSFGQDENGRLVLGDTPLLSSTAYTSQQLRAKADIACTTTGANKISYFTVTLTISYNAGDKDHPTEKPLLSSTFDVIPLNDRTLISE